MLTLQRVHHFILGLATLSVAAVTTPAAATTITVTPQIWDFFDPSFTNNYQLNLLQVNQTHTASVGQIKPTVYNPANGNYAATLEFAIPTLPSDAILTNLSLTVTAFLGDRLGDVSLRTYVAGNTAGDPGRLNVGTVLATNYKPLRTGTTTDLTAVYATSAIKANAGSYLGFSIRETNPRCNSFSCQSYDILGSNPDPTDYPLPILTLTYDVPAPPPPATAVPEPSSWTMMVAGLGIVGAAMWRRRRSRD